MNREQMRATVRGLYDLQKLRIMYGNRIVGNFKVKLGQEPGHKEEELDAEGQKILKRLRASYRKITDGVKVLPKEAVFKGDGVIDTFSELRLVKGLIDLDYAEAEQVKTIAALLKDCPLWTKFLVGVKGVGPLMAGVILSEFDITKAKYPSSFWMFCGLDVAADGAGRSKRKEHLVEREYTNKAGEITKRMSITFNPFLRTKLLGVLAPSFLRAGDNKYSKIYYDYRTRLENHAKYGIVNDAARIAEAREKNPYSKYSPKAHRHNMAIRYTIKMFLIDLHIAWRGIEGLPVSVPYAEAKLGLKHGA